MRRQYLSILFILFLSSITSCLHFGHAPLKHTTAQSELQALKAQQSKLEIQVNSLISNINDVDSKVKKAVNTSDKVQILESAIIMERQTVFNLSNSIVPPFNLSKNACQQLTNDQKINLLDQISKNKQQIAKLKKIAATIPPCDEIKMINSDLQKQSVIIEGIEKILYTKCDSSVILSPTIFQSNIYASNWILGNQTIDDLIEQYYQRSIQYDNITNCPLEFPYFDGSSCIDCQEDLPVFNMFSKQCDSCPQDTKINVDLRVCEQIPHYTDYTKASNYNLDGADGLPSPSPNLTPCPAKTPFWNGKCINCQNGKWWSVKDNICKSCPAGKAFDINERSCVTPSGVPYLTILSGTQWVTAPGNASNVLKQRADLINSNKTEIEYCSSQSPYFDGFQCIACQKQFDLKALKCVDAPANLVYDDNTHAFVPAETNKQTNTKANNLISSGVLINSSVPDCGLQAPYFDGKACITCPSPFILFDLTTKKCVVCDVIEIYNSTSRKCQKRQTVLVSTNFNNLLASPTKSIADYKQELYDKVSKQGDYIVDSCDNPSQYSNYTHCFPCKSTQYFSVDTKKCVTCNGTINQTTMVCIPKKTYLTNLANSSNLVLPQGKKLGDYESQQKSIVGPTENCPSDKPYAVFGQQCIACSAPSSYFNLETQQCSSCGLNEFYDADSRQCEKGVFVSNLTALKKFVEIDNYTVINIRKQIQETAKTRYIIECGASTPFFDGKKCSSCPDNTYVNLKDFTCVTPTLVANVSELFELDNVFEETNYTIDDIDASIGKIKGPIAACPAETPAFNGKNCYSCPEAKYYKLKTNQCVDGKTVSNITTLKTLSNIKQAQNYTISNIEKQISQITLPTLPCNQTKPLYDGKKCISCDSYSQYDLKNLKCIPPQLYTNTTALKTLKVIETQNYTLANVETQNSHIPYPKKPCPSSSPLFNSKQCISCPNGTYYNIKTLDCLAPAFVSNTSAIKKTNSFVQTDNYTLSNIQKQITTNPLPTQLCPESTPFFDGKKCTSCTNSLYNLKQGTCFNCTVDQFYNKTTNKCQEKPHFYPNLTNSNWIVKDNNGVDRVINFTKQRQALANSVPCPQKSEFFSDITKNCQSCPSGDFFNYDTFECVTCGKGQQLDPNTHKCNTRKTGKFQTSLERDNLTYNGIPANQLKDYYNDNKTAYPTIQDCPKQTPFFDGFECISCHSYFPYFNLDTLKCQKCVNSKYDPALHECVQQKQTVSASPDIAKMYSSIF